MWTFRDLAPNLRSHTAEHTLTTRDVLSEEFLKFIALSTGLSGLGYGEVCSLVSGGR